MNLKSSPEDDDSFLSNLNRKETPLYFINSNNFYNFKYDPVKIPNNEELTIPKLPYPGDFDSENSYVFAVKNWYDSISTDFIRAGVPLSIFPVPTSAFYRRFDLEFVPKDVFQKKKLKMKLGEKKYPLSNNNLLELENKVLNGDSNCIIDENEVFKEKSYQNRPLEYKYHFFNNDFFQLVPPEPVPYLFDKYEDYEEAMNNWFQISTQQCPRSNNIKTVEEIGNQLGIQFVNSHEIKTASEIIDACSQTKSLDGFNSIMKTNLNQDEFDKLKPTNFLKLKENLSHFPLSTEQNKNFFSLSFSNQIDSSSFDLLNELDDENISSILIDGMEFGFEDSMPYSPKCNNDILSQYFYTNMNNNKKHRRFDSFPLYLLNNESVDEFAYFVNSTSIDFCEVINTADDFKQFLLLIDSEDKLLSQKATYIIQILFSSEEKYEIYLNTLISFASVDAKQAYDRDFLNNYNLLRKFIRIIEAAGELNDEMIPPMMYKISLEKDEESLFYKSEKNITPDYNNFKDFDKKKVLSIYRLCAQCSLLMTLGVLFDFDHWNLSEVHDYLSFKILKPMMFKLAKKVQKNRNEIVSCYITHTVRYLYQTFKKTQNGNTAFADENDFQKKISNENDEFDEQEEKVSSLTFQKATGSLSKKISLPQNSNEMLIPSIVFHANQIQDSTESKKEDNQSISPNIQLTPPAFFDSFDPLVEEPDDNFPDILNTEDSTLATNESASQHIDNESTPQIIANDNAFISHDIKVFLNSIDTNKNNITGGNSIMPFSPIEENLNDLLSNMNNAYLPLLNDNHEEHQSQMKKMKDERESSKRQKKANKTESISIKHMKHIAYRIIFMIMNIPYPQLHYALFYPSPINFFNSISQLQTKNEELDTFLNIASGSCMKTEKLKSMFLTSYAFKTMIQYIIDFDISILEMSMINFTRRVLLWLNFSADKAFSRKQLDVLLKSYNPSVPRFNYVICPVIAGIYTNTNNYFYKSKNNESRTIQHTSSNSAMIENSELTSSDSILTNDDQKFASIPEPSYSSSTSFIDLNEPSVSILFDDDLDPKPKSAVGNRQKKKVKKASRATPTGIQHTLSIGSFDSSVAQYYSNDIFDASTMATMTSKQYEPRYISVSSSLNDYITTPVLPLMPPSAFSPKDKKKAKQKVSMLESLELSDFLDRAQNQLKQRNCCLMPQYACEELKTDASLIASLLGGLFSTVDASCFPCLLRAVDYLTCSPDVQFPPTFWGKVFGALTVGEITSWIFLRTIFTQGFIKLLPSEFPVFFLLIFKYRLPNEEKEISMATLKKKSDDSDNALNFENLNKTIEHQKQLSLKLMFFTAVIISASESSLSYLSKIMVSNKNYFQTLFLKSVNPSLKIQKLQQIINQNQFNSNVSSSLNLNLFASSYKASMKSIVSKNMGNFKRIVEKLNQYGQKFEPFISLFPKTSM